MENKRNPNPWNNFTVFNCEFDRAVEFIKSNQKPWVAGLRDRRPSGVELVKAFDEKLWGAQ